MSFERIRNLALLFALSILSAGCGNTPLVEPSDPAIGAVIRSTGYPGVSRHNQKYILAQRSLIHAGDIFTTDGSSRVEINLNDDTQVLIGEDSHVLLHRISPEGSSSLTRLNLTRGQLRSTPGTGSRLVLGTPLAKIELASGAVIARYEPNRLEVVLTSPGELTVTNSHGGATIRTRGTGTTVIAGSAPQPPVMWTESRLQRAIAFTSIPSPALHP